MSTSTSVRKLQLQLHDSCVSATAREEAKRVVAEAGMQLSGEGQASLSARMPDEAFRKLFQGSTDPEDLAVPDLLKPFITSITEAPRHLSFNPLDEDHK